MSGRGSRAIAARLLSAAASAALASAPIHAQTAAAQAEEPAELDPNAPLAPMPDLGVDWPDLNAKESEPPPPVAGPKGQAEASAVTDENSEIRYTVEAEGLSAVGNSEELLKAFRQQSALQADRKDPANASQIGRRSSAEADLLTELLRSQGYYDATVEPRTEAAGSALRVILVAEPGPQYRFASVDLPGL